MISEKTAKKYCCDDLSLIENYELAINDTTKTWDCHHRRESIYSAKDLIEIGEYWKRSAAELIFVPHDQHTKLHHKGVSKGPMGKDHKAKLSNKVLQFTKSGEFVREWPSTREAGRELGIAQSGICRCCNGKLKYAGGYVWKYVI